MEICEFKLHMLQRKKKICYSRYWKKTQDMELPKKKRVNVSSLFLNYIKLRALDLSFNATQHFLNVQ